MNYVVLLSIVMCVLYANGPRAFADSTSHENPRARLQWLHDRRASGGPHAADIRARAFEREEARSKRLWAERPLAEQPRWTSLGPATTAGRVRSIAIHPLHDDTLYIGAAGGGVWRSRDGGASWTPLMDNAPGIAMGAVAIDPFTPTTLYAGTGEQVQIASAFLGCGLLRSTDDGASWQTIGLTDVGAFSRVVVHPARQGRIMAACMNIQGGVYRSDDGGSTWQQMLQGQVYDMSMNPADPDEYFIALPDSGIYHTTDAGRTWTRRMAGIDCIVGRSSVQQSASQPDVLYALVECDRLGTIFKSVDRGLTWERLYTGTPAFFAGTNTLDDSQGLYNNCLAIHPTNPDTCLVGGIDIYRSTDGRTFVNVTNGYSRDPAAVVHVDQHCFAFSTTTPGRIYEGNDGGMVRSDDGGATWSAINNGLAITQFYGFDQDPLIRDRLAGGTQDNGTLASLRSATNWDSLYGADGTIAMLDPQRPYLLYGSLPFARPFRINTEERSFRFIVNGLGTDRAVFGAPMAMAPDEPATLYLGRQRIYRSTDSGDRWRASSPAFRGAATSIDVSRGPGLTVWAGSDRGELMVSRDSGTSWRFIDASLVPARWIGDIAINPNNHGIALVGLAGYGSQQLWRTTDTGRTFVSASSGFPDVPVNSLAWHPSVDGLVMAATDVGVYRSDDGGTTWYPYGQGLPRSPAVDVHMNPILDVVRVATHGRGVWECPLGATEPSPPVVVSPAGGERLSPQQTLTVIWLGFNGPVDVAVSTSGTEPYQTLVSNYTGSSYRWTIPTVEAPNVVLRIRATETPGVEAFSAPFSIGKARPGTVLAKRATWWRPNGVAVGKGGTLWTTSLVQGTIVVLDGATMDIIKTVPLQSLEQDSLFYDCSLDTTTGQLAILHHVRSDGSASEIIIADTLGTVLQRLPLNGVVFPQGIEHRDGGYVLNERDGERRLLEVDATATIVRQVANPLTSAFGPRALSRFSDGTLAQAGTPFLSNAIRLVVGLVDRLRSDMTARADRLTVGTKDGVYNIRGVAVDEPRQSLVVSDVNGLILRISGFDGSITSVFEDATLSAASIVPKPARDIIRVDVPCTDCAGGTIDVFNYRGEQVASFALPAAVDGVCSATCDVSTMPSGMYHLRVRVGTIPVAAAPFPIIR
jgi:photosystem II stability/assembly factor-like uncharacterized protein